MAFFFHELKIAESLVKPFQRLAKVEVATYHTTSILVFYCGLVASGLARTTGKRKYKHQAKRWTIKMKAIMQQKGLNNLHRYLLMKANCLAAERDSQKEFNKVKEAFDKSITVAGRSGFTQDAAIGNELAGEYCLLVGDDFWSKHYFSRAYELYLEWGATVKADHMKERRGNYIHLEKLKEKKRRNSMTSNIRDWVLGEDGLLLKSTDLSMLTTTRQESIRELSTASFSYARAGTSSSLAGFDRAASSPVPRRQSAPSLLGKELLQSLVQDVA